MAFLKGAVWGVVIGGAGAAVVSVVAPQPAGLTPPQPPVTVVQDVASGPDPESAAVPDLPQVAAAPPPAIAAQADAMVAPDATAAVPQADGDTAQPAPMDSAVAVPDMPQAPSETLDARPESEEAVLPNPQSIAPAVPEAEADIIVDVAPDAPVVVVTPVPEPTPEVDAAEAETLAQVGATTETAVTVIDPDDPSAALATPDAAGTGNAATGAATDDTPAPAPQDQTADDAAPQPAAETMVVDMADVAAETAPDPALGDAADPMSLAPSRDLDAVTEGDTANAADDPLTDSPPAAPQARTDVETAVDTMTETPDTPDATPDRPAVVAIIDTAPRGLPGGTSGVVVRRPGADAAIAPEPAPEETPAIDEDAPALVRFGAFFDNPADLPLMSVVLIDDGIMPNGARALADVPFPVTVALDPSQPGASARMDAYAAAGIEIAALAAVPDGATAADAAVALEGTFDALPRAVALIGTDNNQLPSATDTLGQIVAMLADDGRGLLVPDTGLNSGLRAATSAEVPAATIFRDLDDNDQDARVIRRFVDQAAFRARQQPGVVLLGRVRAETVSALILWGQANRAGQVALAPLSATLLAQ